jgi:hypothetical protein
MSARQNTRRDYSREREEREERGGQFFVNEPRKDRRGVCMDKRGGQLYTMST